MQNPKRNILNRRVLNLIVFSVAIKFSYFLVAFLLDASQLLPQGLTFNLDSFLSVFHKNDAGWYERIAEQGYPVIENKEELKGYVNGNFQQSSWAFFPLFPGIIWCMQQTFKLNFSIAAFLTILIFSILTCILFYHSAKLYFKKEELAWFSTLLFMVFPFNYHYSMYYTESLFLGLMLGAFLAVYYKKYAFLLLLLPALTLTRPNGMVAAFIVYLYFISQCFKDLPIAISNLLTRKFLLISCIFCAVPLTLVAYSFYQYNMTGDFFAFNTAQHGWDKRSMFPILALFRKMDFTNLFNSIYICLVFAFFLFHARKISFYWWIFIALTILLPLSKGSVTSMPRYMSVLLPLYFLITPYITAGKHKYSLLLLLLLLQWSSLYFWLQRHPFSY